MTVCGYADTPMLEEDLLKILKVGRWSPMALNAHSQRVLILRSRESLAKVREFCIFSYDEKYGELAEECVDWEHGCNVYYYGPTDANCLLRLGRLLTSSGDRGV